MQTDEVRVRKRRTLLQAPTDTPGLFAKFLQFYPSDSSFQTANSFRLNLF